MGGQASYIKTTNAPVLVYYHKPELDSDYLSASNNLAARTFFSGSGLSQRVVSFWFRLVGGNDGNLIFIGNSGDTTPSISLYVEAGGLFEITTTNDAAGNAYASGNTVVSGAWCHVFFYTVSDGGSLPGHYIFINGASDDYFDDVTNTFATARDDFHLFPVTAPGDTDIANIAIFPMGTIYSEHLGANGRAYATALYEAGPQHDVRQPYKAWPGKTPSFYWRDQGIVNASSKIVIPNRGTGGACDLVLNGNCSVVAF